MNAATLTYIDADLAEKQRKVLVVVFFMGHSVHLRSTYLLTYLLTYLFIYLLAALSSGYILTEVSVQSRHQGGV